MAQTSPARLAGVVSLLRRAERECTARGNQAPTPLDDLAIWHLDAHLVWIATETLRGAATSQLPQPDPQPSPARSDPLQLLEAAWNELQQVPDEFDNVALFLGRLYTADALAAVRTHYA